jgi:hypothetical protein
LKRICTLQSYYEIANAAIVEKLETIEPYERHPQKKKNSWKKGGGFDGLAIMHFSSSWVPCTVIWVWVRLLFHFTFAKGWGKHDLVPVTFLESYCNKDFEIRFDHDCEIHL